MRWKFAFSWLALITLVGGSLWAQNQFKPAIGPPPGGMPANPKPSRFPPLTELKSEYPNWPEREELSRVRVLLVGDTNDKLGNLFQTELNKMQELLTAGIGADKLDVTVLKGNDASPQKILEYYRDLQTGANEAIVFYYTGHGCKDRTRQIDPIWAGGHMMGMHGGALYRADLYKAMKVKKAGLTVLISACCSSDETTPNNPSTASGVLAPATRGTAEQIRHVGRCLFLQHRGVMDLTAAMDSQYAYSNGETIGLTPALFRIFHSPQQFLPRGGFITWPAFHSALNKEMGMMLALQGASFTQLAPMFEHGPLAHSPWVNELENGTRSTWSFFHLGNGRYKALEFGLGQADGTAVLTGYRLHIDFTVADGTAGTYDVDMLSGEGKCTLTKGPAAGRSFRVTFSEGEFDRATNQVHKVR